MLLGIVATTVVFIANKQIHSTHLSKIWKLVEYSFGFAHQNLSDLFRSDFLFTWFHYLSKIRTKLNFVLLLALGVIGSLYFCWHYSFFSTFSSFRLQMKLLATFICYCNIRWELPEALYSTIILVWILLVNFRIPLKNSLAWFSPLI